MANSPAGILALVKRVARDRYAWPGGYELFAITSDGGTLCNDCCRKEFRNIAHSTIGNYRDGWQCEAIDATCNIDSELNCDHCGRTIHDPEA